MTENKNHINDTSRLKERKWGIFTHYLYHEQNGTGTLSNTAKVQTDWDECVESFDAEKYAAEIAKTGAGYAFFTVMQGTQFMCAPNDTYNEITGYKTGEACSKRDLIEDLYNALHKYDIDLYLYFTGDGPYKDEKAGNAFGFNQFDKDNKSKVTESFVRKWASVLKEYSVKYGDKVRGWWIDGCYDDKSLGYTDELLKIYREAVLAGNPNAIVAFNNGDCDFIKEYSVYDDFTAGEMNDFFDLPKGEFKSGVLWHTLAPLGISPDGSEWGSWCKPGVKRNLEYMDNYIKNVNERGGVVTIDVILYRDGSFDSEQMKLLKGITVRGR